MPPPFAFSFSKGIQPRFPIIDTKRILQYYTKCKPENTVKTVGMYKETREAFVKVYKQKAFPSGEGFQTNDCGAKQKYRAVQTTRYLKSYWVS